VKLETKKIKAAQFLLSCVLLLACVNSLAGYFEISASGSYYKYNFGLSSGRPAFNKTKQMGAGLAYRLMSNTSLELSYSYSNALDVGGYDISTLPDIYYISKTTEVKNLSISLVIELAAKKSTFSPYISGGGGYMIRKTTQAGSKVDRITSAESSAEFSASPEEKSASATGTAGFKIYMTDSLALDFKSSLYASDLDKEEIYLHYSLTGGLKFLF